MTDSTITCNQCGDDFEPGFDVEDGEVELCFDCAVRQTRKRRREATNEDINPPGLMERRQLKQEHPIKKQLRDGLDGAEYRIEAEASEEDYAYILKQIIEDTDGCRLTAFDKLPRGRL